MNCPVCIHIDDRGKGIEEFIYMFIPERRGAPTLLKKNDRPGNPPPCKIIIFQSRPRFGIGISA